MGNSTLPPADCFIRHMNLFCKLRLRHFFSFLILAMNCPNCFASTSCHFLLLFPLRYFKVCKAFLQSQHRGKQAVLSIYESFTSHFATIISSQMNISGNKYPYEQTQSSKCSNACKNHSIHLKSYSLMIFNSLGISLKSFKNASAFLLRGARHAIA